MGKRLSKIYTRTGDDGTTGLGDGSRTHKDTARVEAYGTVDEANSAIGMVLAESSVPAGIRECLTEVQHDLFELGGELCIPGHSAITQDFIARLESELDTLNADLPALKEFILPGGVVLTSFRPTMVPVLGFVEAIPILHQLQIADHGREGIPHLVGDAR